MHAVFTSEEEMIEGFGLYMTQTSISNSERKCTAKNIGYQMKFLLDIIKESGSAKLTAYLAKIKGCHFRPDTSEQKGSLLYK